MFRGASPFPYHQGWLARALGNIYLGPQAASNPLGPTHGRLYQGGMGNDTDCGLGMDRDRTPPNLPVVRYRP